MFSLGTNFRGLMAVAAASAALAAAASPAAAGSIFLDNAGIYNPGKVLVTGAGFGPSNELAGPVLFNANYGVTGSATTFAFVGFCVDLYDNIAVGLNSQGGANLGYHEAPLVNNGAHSPYPDADLVTFSQIQLDDIAKLVTFGTNLWNADAVSDPSHNISNSLANQLAAVQGAIWQIENPSFSVSGNAAINGYLSTYTSQAWLDTQRTGKIDAIFANDGAHQTFAFAVPEPATWAMMIMGFGAIGAMLRRRRAVVATVA